MSTASTTGSVNGVTSYEAYLEEVAGPKTESADMGQDTFLKLLTTQLQHQDPMNPMDNEQFIAQLSQFSSLEQLTEANSNLENLMVGMNSMSNANMVNMIGKEVRALGDGFHYESGNKTLYFNLESDVDQATISIFDMDGTLVKKETLAPLSGGENTYEWDGLNDKGQPVNPGDYTFSLAAANGSSAVGAATYTQGLVDQIDFTGGVAAPRIDGQNVTVDMVLQIYEPVELGE